MNEHMSTDGIGQRGVTGEGPAPARRRRRWLTRGAGLVVAGVVVLAGGPAQAYYDASYYDDLDGNGTWDLAWDSNSDGWIDAWYYDTDGDGAWNFGAADVSGNGVFDRYDLEGDGVFDSVDTNEDGYLDLSLRPLPSGPMPQSYGAGNDYLGGVQFGDVLNTGCAWC